MARKTRGCRASAFQPARLSTLYLLDVQLNPVGPGFKPTADIRILHDCDDFGDFVPCARKKVVAPCTEPATRARRHEALDAYDAYWGNGWYILPNPMHGSWTSVR